MSGVTLSTLAPYVPKSAKQRKDTRRVLNKIIRAAAQEYQGDDLLEHVYHAGLWHGSELATRALTQGETPAQTAQTKGDL